MMSRYFKVIILIASYCLLFIQKSKAQSYDCALLFWMKSRQ